MSEPARERMDYKLLKALRRGDETVVRAFFSQDTESSEVTDHAADVERRSWRGVTAGRNSALHIVAGLGHLDLAMLICARDSSLLVERNAVGETPLHCAARAGADRIVSHFISAVAADSSRLEEVLLAEDLEGKTALYAAAEEGHAPAARVLMSSLPDLATVVDNEGVSPLYVAVLSESLEVVQILIEHSADASYGGPNGQTALHAAMWIKNPEFAENLLQWKPILTNEVDISGSTPLHYLATTFNSYMVSQLLKRDTSQAYVKDNKGLCPVHIASRHGRSNIVRELIKHCPDMDELVDKEGRNFLHIAVEHQRVVIVKLVCQRPLLVKMMNAKDNNGNMPLHLAIKYQHQGIIRLLLESKIVHGRIKGKSGKTLQDDEITRLRHRSSFSPSQPKMEPKKELIERESHWPRPRPPCPCSDNQTLFEPEMITEEVMEEEDDDQTVLFGREWKQMGDKLLDASMRGDESIVRTLFPPATEASVVEEHTTIHVPRINNVAYQAGHRSWTRDSSLLEARNAALETPLHCAARAGADRIVSLFISEARGLEEGRQLEAVLRATDREGKTALHAAAEQGHAVVVGILVSADPGLAAIVDDNGVSPLYAAVLSKSLQVVQKLIKLSAKGGNQAGTTSAGATAKTSYAGPNRQTALHAAAIVESPEITDKLLQWEPTLIKKVDNSESTPLHYLVTTLNITMVRQLLEYDASTAYHSDSEGFYPIHIAARMGSCGIIRELIDRRHGMDKLVDNQGRNFHGMDELVDNQGRNFHGMDELVDNQGRNFLHIAVLENRPMVVKYVCQHRELAKMMNARDNRGNTPLHHAVFFQNQKIVSLLLENRSVHPSIKNKDGKTPLDLAITAINYCSISIQNPEIWIFHCLQQIGAIRGPQRLDRLIYDSIYKHSTKQNHENELKKYKSTAQNLVIVSVLIATVTFAAAFTMPGGNIADDHQNGGTPTLARKYPFTAFIISDCIAFFCSIMATIWLMYAGSLAIHPSRQLQLILRSQDFMDVAAQSMMAAFALSVYVVLAPVNSLIALAVCIFAFPSVLLSSPDFWQRFRLTMTLMRRLGWSAMCKARFIGRPLGLATKSFNWYIFKPIVSYLLVYILIFGVSLILSIKHLHFT